MSPAFLESHFHLENALLWDGLLNQSGTLHEAIELYAAVKTQLSVEDIVERSGRALRAAVEHGTLWLRSHVDIDHIAGLNILKGVVAARERFGYLATIQLVAFPQLGLARNPEAGQQIVEAGHELGNHSFSHKRMILRPYADIRDEIEETDRLIRAAGYEGDIHFRAPFGKKLVVLPYYLWRTGRQNIAWDVAPEGYAGATAGAGGLVEAALREAGPGSIILLHVMAASRETSREALPEIIRGLRERGYRLVTVSELLAASPD